MQNRNPNPGGVRDRVTVRDRAGAKPARLVFFFILLFLYFPFARLRLSEMGLIHFVKDLTLST